VLFILCIFFLLSSLTLPSPFGLIFTIYHLLFLCIYISSFFSFPPLVLHLLHSVIIFFFFIHKNIFK
jgi:hypothetical protein